MSLTQRWNRGRASYSGGTNDVLPLRAVVLLFVRHDIARSHNFPAPGDDLATAPTQSETVVDRPLTASIAE